MVKSQLPTGTGYFDIDLIIPFNDFDIHITSILNECLFESVRVSNENFLHLLYFQEGNVIISFNHNEYSIGPNTFVVFTYGHEHIETLLNTSSIKYHVYYAIKSHKRKSKVKDLNNFQKESALIKEIFNNKKDIEIIKDLSDNTNNLFKKIVFELESNFSFQNYSFFSLFLNIFINCSRSYYVNKLQPNYTDYVSSYYFFNRIVAHLENESRTVTLKNMSEQFHISERQIQRYINKFFGMTFKQKTSEIRIYKAKELLKTTNLSIASIANEVGYKQTSDFIRVFKSLEKTTPLQYKKTI